MISKIASRTWPPSAMAKSPSSPSTTAKAFGMTLDHKCHGWERIRVHPQQTTCNGYSHRAHFIPSPLDAAPNRAFQRSKKVCKNARVRHFGQQRETVKRRLDQSFFSLLAVVILDVVGDRCCCCLLLEIWIHVITMIAHKTIYRQKTCPALTATNMA
jgi:hypothetical protein